MRSTLPRLVALAGALTMAGGAGSCAGDPVDVAPTDAVIVAFDQSITAWPRDDWDFRDAAVIDGRLRLEVAYGGGCATHDLWLLAVHGFSRPLDLVPGGVAPTAIVPVLLAHDSHDDPCDAYLTRTLHFDLAPLRSEFRRQIGDGPGRIVLRIPEGQGSSDTTSVDFTFD